MGGIVSSSSRRGDAVSLASTSAGGLKYVRNDSIDSFRKMSPQQSPNTAHRKMLENTHNAAQSRTEREARILIAQGKADKNLMSTESILFGMGNAFQRRRSLTMAENTDENGHATNNSPEMYGTTRAGRKTQELVEASRRRRLNSVGNLTKDPNSPTSKLFSKNIGSTAAADEFRAMQYANAYKNNMLLTAAETVPLKPSRPDVSATPTSILVKWRPHQGDPAMIEKWEVQWRQVPSDEFNVSDDSGDENEASVGKEKNSPNTIEEWLKKNNCGTSESHEHCDTDGYYTIPNKLIKRFAKSVMVNGLPPMCDMLEYRVRACSPGGGWGPWSDNSAMIQTTAPEIEIPKPPDVVSSTTTTIFLQWEVPRHVKDSGTIFKIMGRRKLGKSLVVLYMGENNTFNVGETGTTLIPGTEYEFNLTYILSDGKNLVSSMCYARTLTATANIYSQETKAGVLLPLGWSEELDERTGDTYYYHVDSGATQWDPPEPISIPKLNSPFHKKRFSFLFYIWGAPHTNRATYVLQINRSRLLYESFIKLKKLDMKDLRMKLKLEYINEQGIDSGGLTKDWFLSISKEMLDVRRGLFQEFKSSRCFHIDARSAIANEEHLEYFEFFGKVLAKAIFERQMVDARLSISILRHLCGKPIVLEDLGELDPQYFIGLSWMLNNNIEDVIYENFTVIQDNFGSKETIELIPGGKKIEVTERNKRDYVEAVAKWRLHGSVKDQLDAISKGFHSLIPPAAAASLKPLELALLLNGRSDIDLEGLKANAQYTGGLTKSSAVCHYFWQVMDKMGVEQRRTVLKYITGTSQYPLDTYDPPFTLTHAEGEMSTALPRAHTCFNQIVLPPYQSPKVLREKLTYAIENTEGFYLT